MRIAILIAVLLIGFTPKAKSQALAWELVELATYYFMSWEEASFQAEVRPGLSNSFFSYGFRGGHTNANGSLTGGMSFYYSQDNLHGSIPDGKFINYHVGVYFEKKFRLLPNQKLYLSIPATLALGESFATTVIPVNYPRKSGFVYFEPELLLNYGINDDVQLHFGPGYRFTSGSTTYGLNDKSLSGLSFQVGIRFGNFM
ncbi:MAG: hypothetical protein JKY54_17040 [Flavobacteriales bacterium]|nr:hypothetical protein [Flavobacteriales bacterium]